MFDLLEEIAHADEIQIEEILQAVRVRYIALFPDRELSIFSLEKSSDQNEQLDKIIAFLQTLKNDA